MIVDIKFKDFYLQFIGSIKENIKKNQDIIEDTTKKRDEIYNEINNAKDLLKDKLNIDLDKYTEWKDKIYNPTLALFGVAYYYINRTSDAIIKHHLGNIIQFTYCLKKIYMAEHRIEINNKASKLTYRQYTFIVSSYYNKVHKFLLNGYGYKYQGGIGTFIINHWKFDNTKSKRMVLDYNATNKRKKELIAKGLKPYDDKEAAWYKARHIPYDGIDYKVYQTNSSYYEFCFIKSSLVHSKRGYDYKRTEYVSAKYRGMSYQKIADTFVKKDEDVYDMQLDIKYKLNILLYRNPTIYLNFVRNAEQNRYKY